MKQSVDRISRVASRNSAIFAVGIGLLAFGAAGTQGFALPGGSPGWQEQAAPQGTSGTDSNAQDASRKKLDKPEDVDPLKRQLTDKQKITRRKELHQELSDTYKTWLNQDVVWIISDEEKKAFRNLSNDEERDAFIEQFWLRRNPNPDSPDNEFREEHYRRIAYANEHFAAGKPGWKTDRGHIYISFGKPDLDRFAPFGRQL